MKDNEYRKLLNQVGEMSAAREAEIFRRVVIGIIQTIYADGVSEENAVSIRERIRVMGKQMDVLNDHDEKIITDVVAQIQVHIKKSEKATKILTKYIASGIKKHGAIALSTFPAALGAAGAIGRAYGTMRAGKDALKAKEMSRRSAQVKAEKEFSRKLGLSPSESPSTRRSTTADRAPRPERGTGGVTGGSVAEFGEITTSIKQMHRDVVSGLRRIEDNLFDVGEGIRKSMEPTLDEKEEKIESAAKVVEQTVKKVKPRIRPKVTSEEKEGGGMLRGLAKLLDESSMVSFAKDAMKSGVMKRLAPVLAGVAGTAVIAGGITAALTGVMGSGEGGESRPVNNLSPEKKAVADQIVASAKEHGVNPLHALSMAHSESSLDPNAKAAKGSASGLFGVTDDTWKSLGGGDRSDISEQIRVGMLYMKKSQEQLGQRKDIYGDIDGFDMKSKHFWGFSGSDMVMDALKRNPNANLEDAFGNREADKLRSYNPNILKDGYSLSEMNNELRSRFLSSEQFAKSYLESLRTPTSAATQRQLELQKRNSSEIPFSMSQMGDPYAIAGQAAANALTAINNSPVSNQKSVVNDNKTIIQNNNLPEDNSLEKNDSKFMTTLYTR